MSLHRTARRTRGLLVLLMTYAVLSAAVVLAPLTWGAAGAQAAEDDLLHVQIDLVSPAIAGPGTEVRLEGTLQNLGSTPTPVHAVRVSTAYRGLDTRGAVQDWAEAGTLETPIVLGEDHIGVAVAPGSTVHWFVDVPADQFDPGFEFATLPLRVEVLATGPAPGEDADDSGETPAVTTVPDTEVRTYLPWTAPEDTEFNPVQIAWLAPLALPGDADLVDVDDARRTDAWVEAVGPDSRTVALLDGLADTQATFVVDPAVLAPLDPVASLTEVVELPGDQVEPSESPEPTDPEPTNPEPTNTEPTNPAPADPGATDPASPPTPTGADPAPSAGVQGSVATGAPGTEVTQPPGDGAAPTSPPTSTTTETPTAPIEDPDPVVPPTPPTIQSVVGELGGRIGQLPEGRLWWLPVGDTDVGALLEVGTDVGDIAELVGRAPDDGLPAPGRTDLAWPLSEQFNDGTIESLQQVWSAAGGATGAAGADNGSLGGVVLPNQVLEDTVLTGSAVRTHAAGPQLIGYDERLSGIVAGSGEQEQAGHATQRFLAETLAIYQEGPATDRSLVVAIPRTAEADAAQLQALTTAASGAPWLQETTASGLMNDATQAPATPVRPPSTPDSATTPGPAQPTEDQVPAAALGDLAAYSVPGDSPLTTSRVRRVELVRDTVVGVAEIVPGSETAARTWLHVLDRQFSASWRSDPQGWEVPVEVAEELTSEITTGLTINPTTINLYADEGLMQITVVNDLPIPIEDLQMRVDPGNGRLRVLGQPDPITIGPESRATVQFRAKAVAAGQVPLHTSLSTPNGTQIGSAEETVVRVQPTGVWIYWLLGGVAGVILVLGLWRALRPAGARRDAAEPADQNEQNVAAAESDKESDVETP